MMPVFLRRTPVRPSADALHASYKPQASVCELALNGRACKTLESLGVSTIGELLVTPVERLMEQWGFGPTSLDIVHKELASFLLNGKAAARDVDVSSYEDLVETLIDMTTAEPRDIDILKKRLGLSDEGVWSLGKLAEKYGLTRERIRQIEETDLQEMSLRARRAAFEDFWETVFGIVDDHKKRHALPDVARKLGRAFQWPDIPQPKAFAKLLGLSPELKVDRKSGLVMRW